VVGDPLSSPQHVPTQPGQEPISSPCSVGEALGRLASGEGKGPAGDQEPLGCTALKMRRQERLTGASSF
jgi:hypothetical protein